MNEFGLKRVLVLHIVTLRKKASLITFCSSFALEGVATHRGTVPFELLCMI